MKKIPFLILFAFCLTSVLSGIFLCQPVVLAETASANIINIENEEQLAGFMNGETPIEQGSVLQLTKNMDMSDYPATSTLGTLEQPFVGTFDGKGYKISNLRIDLTEKQQSNQYAGLFGYVNGQLSDTGRYINSQIKNLALENITIQLAEGVQTSVGAVVGRAEHTTLQNIQISDTNIRLQKKSGESFVDYTFDVDTNFGAIAGVLQDSTLSFAISRPNLQNFVLGKNNGKILNFGGLAGRLASSQATFCVVESNFNATVSSDFDGVANFGGAVGRIEQDNSEIINIAMENSFNISQHDNVNVAEIAGAVSKSAPKSGNISFVYYKPTNIEDIFGDENYQYSDKDFLRPALYSLSPLEEVNGKYPYFSEPDDWHPEYGGWDLDSIWYVDNRGEILLQNFDESLSVAVSSDTSEDSLINTDLQIWNNGEKVSRNSFKYGDEVRMQFEFTSVVEDGKVVGSMKDFTEFSTLRITKPENNTRTDVARILNIDGAFSIFNIPDNGRFSIETTEDKNGFVVIINSLDNTTSGTYSIVPERKSFRGQIYSKLFDIDGNEVEGSEAPAYVYHASYGSSIPPTTEMVTLPDMYFNSEYTLRSTVKTGRPYSFVGWYMIKSDGQTIKIDDEKYVDQNNNLHIVFGHDIFTSDFEIYARYDSDSCIITFIADKGVASIHLSGDELENTNTTRPVSKKEDDLRLEIYVYKEFDFDVEQFIGEMSYEGDDPTIPFCRLVTSDTTQEDYNFYQFEINMTILNRTDYDAGFTINIRTSESNHVDNSWIWWVVGGTIGAIVLAVVITLVIWLIMRRRNGGGTKISRKNYKNLYY